MSIVLNEEIVAAAGGALESELSPVAKTGDYADLSGKPDLFSGEYSDLTGSPDFDDGSYVGSFPVQLSTPAILPALGDMLDAVPRSVRALDPTIVGNGVTDQTTKLINVMAQGSKNIIFPPADGAYVIDGRVRLYSGQKISGLAGSSLLQKQKYMQTLDAQGADDLTVQGLTIKGDYALTYEGDFGERGDNHSSQSCGIWSNGNRVIVRDCHFEAMTVGLWFIPFDIGANALVGQNQDNRLFDSTFKNISFGVLAKRQDDLSISRLRGRDILLSGPSADYPAGSPNEQHLIYITGQATDRSNNLSITDIHGRNVPQASLVQVKWTDGLNLKGMTVRGGGIMTLVNCKQFKVSAYEGSDCDDINGTGAVKIHNQASDMTTKCEDGLVSGGKIHMKAGTTRSFSVIADRVTVRDLVVNPNRTSSGTEADIHIKGSLNCDVEAKVVNGAFGSRAALVDVVNSVNSDGNRVKIQANNVQALVRVAANQTNTQVEYDVSQCSFGTGGTALFDSGTGTVLKMTPRTLTVTASTAAIAGVLFGSGANDGQIRGARTSRVEINFDNASAYTIASPAESTAANTPVGTVIEYVIINTTAGALGTITWANANPALSIFKFKTSFAAPGGGLATSYRFRFNGTSWVEI